jgi:hypothetical protein
MSLVVVLAIWIVLGGALYRSHRRAASTPEQRPPDARAVRAELRKVRVEVPDTVPSDWVEAYRSENDGG